MKRYIKLLGILIVVLLLSILILLCNFYNRREETEIKFESSRLMEFNEMSSTSILDLLNSNIYKIYITGTKGKHANLIVETDYETDINSNRVHLEEKKRVAILFEMVFLSDIDSGQQGFVTRVIDELEIKDSNINSKLSNKEIKIYQVLKMWKNVKDRFGLYNYWDNNCYTVCDMLYKDITGDDSQSFNKFFKPPWIKFFRKHKTNYRDIEKVRHDIPIIDLSLYKYFINNDNPLKRLNIENDI